MRDQLPDVVIRRYATRAFGWIGIITIMGCTLVILVISQWQLFGREPLGPLWALLVSAMGLVLLPLLLADRYLVDRVVLRAESLDVLGWGSRPQQSLPWADIDHFEGEMLVRAVMKNGDSILIDPLSLDPVTRWTMPASRAHHASVMAQTQARLDLQARP